MSDAQPLISLRNVSSGYGGEAVLTGVNLDVFRHDFIGVIGPNGGGKTTLVKTIIGLIKPYGGKIIGNYNHIGYLPQVNTTDKAFPITVSDVVLSGLLSAAKGKTGFDRNDRKKRDETLETVGMLSLSRRNIGSLSGGQAQRVMLARAIVSDPDVLILDEPGTFVDSKFEHDMYSILKELNQRMAILMISHDLGTITSYVKTIACVNRQLHYHPSNVITETQLAAYNCPIQLITHGHVPHTVLAHHPN